MVDRLLINPGVVHIEPPVGPLSEAWSQLDLTFGSFTEFILLLRYPDSWYRDITSNKKFFSLAATYRGAIVGMIVAEIKSRTKIHKEVSMCGADGAAGTCDRACCLLCGPDHI